MASDRYCGNRHYCDIGSVCQRGGGCRTQASIDAEANLRSEQEREEQERAQRRREEQEASPGGQTNFAQPASSPLDSLANGICPTNSQSDVTGLGGSSAPTLLPPKPNCKLPGAGFGELYNHVFNPRGEPLPTAACPPAAYESGSAAATGWVSLGCQMGRERDQLQWARSHEICQADCLRHGTIIHPNRNATITTDACKSNGGSPHNFNKYGNGDNDVIVNAVKRTGKLMPQERWPILSAFGG
jgi:hypothetical protein